MSFRLKTFLGVVLIEAILLGFLVVSGAYYLRASNQTQLEDRAYATAQLISTMISDSVITSDLATLDSLVEQVLRNDGIDYVKIRGIAGTILSSDGTSAALSLAPTASVHPNAEWKGGRYYVSKNIYMAGQKFGTVELGLSTAAVDVIIDDALRWMGAVAVAKFVLVVFLGIFLGQYLARHLRSLRDGARKVEQGAFGFQVAIPGKDELAQAATSFNAMSTALARFAHEQQIARAAAERRTRVAESILDDAVASMGAAILIADEHGRILRVNDAFFSIFPKTNINALTSKSLRDIIAWMEEEDGVALDVRTEDLSGANSSFRHIVLADRRHLQVGYRATGLGGSVVVITDITEFHRAEERARMLQKELLHAQKMESLGTLASGIAHEINTPTQFIGDNLRFLRDVVDELMEAAGSGATLPNYLLDDTLGAIQESIEGIDRIGGIVKSMRSFSYPDPSSPEPHNLNECIEVAVNISRALWKDVAFIHLDLDENLPDIRCKPGEINQVLLNLISNAVDAIKAARVDKVSGTIVIRSFLRRGMAEIQVSDDGVGIPPDAREHIFDMFYTTKKAGNGTGQGLAIASAIITAHGGQLEVDTPTDGGTVFRLLLPTTNI